jgi:ribosome maturation factor RimP
MEDRAALLAMTAQLDSINSLMLEFTAQMDSSQMYVDKSINTMQKELTTVKTNASSTRMVIRRINDNVDNLPVKALETFNEAINEYLTKDEAATE